MLDQGDRQVLVDRPVGHRPSLVGTGIRDAFVGRTGNHRERGHHHAALAVVLLGRHGRVAAAGREGDRLAGDDLVECVVVHRHTEALLREAAGFVHLDDVVHAFCESLIGERELAGDEGFEALVVQQLGHEDVHVSLELVPVAPPRGEGGCSLSRESLTRRQQIVPSSECLVRVESGVGKHLGVVEEVVGVRAGGSDVEIPVRAHGRVDEPEILGGFRREQVLERDQRGRIAAGGGTAVHGDDVRAHLGDRGVPPRVPEGRVGRGGELDGHTRIRLLEGVEDLGICVGSVLVVVRQPAPDLERHRLTRTTGRSGGGLVIGSVRCRAVGSFLGRSTSGQDGNRSDQGQKAKAASDGVGQLASFSSMDSFQLVA